MYVSMYLVKKRQRIYHIDPKPNIECDENRSTMVLDRYQVLVASSFVRAPK